MNNRIELRRIGSTESVSGLSTDWSRRAECGNSGCSGRWLSLLKDRRRPIFEGKWGCSVNCLRALVATAIRREAAEEGTANQENTHHHRIPLGLILLERGWISRAQLAHALEMQQREKTGLIGEWLIAQCGVDKDRITRALAMQWSCPVLTMADFNAEAMALAVPRSLMEAHGIVPVRIGAGRMLYLASAHRPDASAAFAVERMSAVKVENGIVDPAEWTKARDRLRECDFVSESMEWVADAETLARKMSSTLIGLQPRAARMVRVHQFYWLRLWLETGAMTGGDGGVPRTKEDVIDRIYRLGAVQ